MNSPVIAETPVQKLVKAWGKSLRDRRAELRITQTDLGVRVHLSQATVSSYELGKAPWTPDVMLSFAMALDARVAHLFPWPEYIEDVEKVRLEAVAKRTSELVAS